MRNKFVVQIDLGIGSDTGTFIFSLPTEHVRIFLWHSSDDYRKAIINIKLTEQGLQRFTHLAPVLIEAIECEAIDLGWVE